MEYLEALFREVATRVADGREIIGTPCPDQYVGIIGEFTDANGTAQRDFPCRNKVDERPKNIPCVVMILESPHTEEYDNIQKRWFGPANGQTGKNIRNHNYWGDVFGRKSDVSSGINYSGYGLILMNSVRYQCSLGYDPIDVAIRNVVFEEMWDSELVRDNFIERLQRFLLHSADVVVNCCTAAKAKPPLRRLVQSTIGAHVFSHPVMRRTHPSSWVRNIRSRQNKDWPYVTPVLVR